MEALWKGRFRCTPANQRDSHQRLEWDAKLWHACREPSTASSGCDSQIILNMQRFAGFFLKKWSGLHIRFCSFTEADHRSRGSKPSHPHEQRADKSCTMDNSPQSHSYNQPLRHYALCALLEHGRDRQPSKKPWTRCVDKTMGLALWKMSEVPIINRGGNKGFCYFGKVLKTVSKISPGFVQITRTKRDV